MRVCTWVWGLFLTTYKSPSVSPTSVHPSWALGPTRLNPAAFRCHQRKPLLPRTKGTQRRGRHSVLASSARNQRDSCLALSRYPLFFDCALFAPQLSLTRGPCPPSPALSPPSTLPHSPCAHTCEQSFVQECTHMCVRTCLLAQRESAGEKR